MGEYKTPVILYVFSVGRQRTSSWSVPSQSIMWMVLQCRSMNGEGAVHCFLVSASGGMVLCFSVCFLKMHLGNWKEDGAYLPFVTSRQSDTCLSDIHVMATKKLIRSFKTHN